MHTAEYGAIALTFIAKIPVVKVFDMPMGLLHNDRVHLGIHVTGFRSAYVI